MNTIENLFKDLETTKKIQERLQIFFEMAEADSSRAGKIGMEIGSARERIIIALLMYKFGIENIKTDIPITETEIDVILFGKPISIKTTSGKKMGSVKLIWTVDAKKALEFSKNYMPTCDIMLAHINWGSDGYLYFFPLEVQKELLNKIGHKNYIKLPKPGTNPRGVEIKSEALEALAASPKTLKIKINWTRKNLTVDAYKKWVELWNE
jgi:hypothetical protein